MIPVRAPNQAPFAGAITPETPGSFTAKGNTGDVLDHLPLAMNDEFPRTPVNVVEFDGNDFSGT